VLFAPVAFAEPLDAFRTAVIDVADECVLDAADLTWLAFELTRRISLAVAALIQALSNSVITIRLGLQADYEFTTRECKFIIGVNRLPLVGRGSTD
jgi:hypothetical protein